MDARRPRASADIASLAAQQAQQFILAASLDLVSRCRISSVSAVSMAFSVALISLKEFDVEVALNCADACVQREAEPDPEARNAAIADVEKAFGRSWKLPWRGAPSRSS